MKTKIMFDANLLIKLPSEMKKKAENKAELMNQTTSEYVRGLITKDLMGEK